MSQIETLTDTQIAEVSGGVLTRPGPFIWPPMLDCFRPWRPWLSLAKKGG